MSKLLSRSEDILSSLNRFFGQEPFAFRFYEVSLDDWKLKSWTRVEERELGQKFKFEIQNELLPQAELSRALTTFSVSHTRSSHGYGMIVLGSFSSIGIDLEASTREVSDLVLKRIRKSSEIQFGLRGIDLWTLKEALFKANPKNEGTYLSMYEIIEWDSVSKKGKGKCSSVERSNSAEPKKNEPVFDLMLFEIGGWKLAVARKN